jgi:hypothetical protein
MSWLTLPLHVARTLARVRAGTRTAATAGMTLSDVDMELACGGAKLDLHVPGRSRDRFVAACGPQIDAFTNARQDSTGHPGDTRKEIDAVTAGRTLALCATNSGFDPPPSWRFNQQRR